MTCFTATPQPPYYAVIFTSRRNDTRSGYDGTAARMPELAAQQSGFLGIESVRDAQGVGIIVSYGRDKAVIMAWDQHAGHRLARECGKCDRYAAYHMRAAKVCAYGFDNGGAAA